MICHLISKGALLLSYPCVVKITHSLFLYHFQMSASPVCLSKCVRKPSAKAICVASRLYKNPPHQHASTNTTVLASSSSVDGDISSLSLTLHVNLSDIHCELVSRHKQVMHLHQPGASGVSSMRAATWLSWSPDSLPNNHVRSSDQPDSTCMHPVCSILPLWPMKL